MSRIFLPLFYILLGSKYFGRVARALYLEETTEPDARVGDFKGEEHNAESPILYLDLPTFFLAGCSYGCFVRILSTGPKSNYIGGPGILLPASYK